MPKVRTLDPEFWDDTVIDALPRDERLLAAALITLLADDEGRFIASSTAIKKRVFGLDKDIKAERVEAMLQHMASAWPNLRLYKVGGQLYGMLLKFPEKQGIRYVVKSKLPAYDKSLDINDCENLPQIPEISRRVGLSSVGLSRVERAAKSGTRVPEPFPLTEELRQWAERKYPAVDLGEQTEAFVRYWRGISGAKGLKLDWPGTWQNDVQRCSEMGKHRRAPEPPPAKVPPPKPPSEAMRLYEHLQAQKGAK